MNHPQEIPGYLSLLARHYAVWQQGKRDSSTDPRIVGRHGSVRVVNMNSKLSEQRVAVLEQHIQHIARCFGVPANPNVLKEFKADYTHRTMVVSASKLRALYKARKARTFHDLAVAIAEGYPTLCLNPEHATPLPEYQGHLDTVLNP